MCIFCDWRIRMEIFLRKYYAKTREFNQKNKSQIKYDLLDKFLIVSLIIYSIAFVIALIVQIIFDNPVVGQALAFSTFSYVVLFPIYRHKENKKKELLCEENFLKELEIIKSLFETKDNAKNKRKKIYNTNKQVWSKETINDIIILCDKHLSDNNRIQEMIKNYILVVGFPFLFVVVSGIFGKIDNINMYILWTFLICLFILFIFLILYIIETHVYGNEKDYKRIRYTLLEYKLTQEYFELD